VSLRRAYSFISDSLPPLGSLIEKGDFKGVQRRSFLKNTTGVLAASGLRSGWLHALSTGDWIDLRQVAIITPTSHTAREANAARVLVEESYKRCGLDWSTEANPQRGAVAIYVGTRASWSKLGQRVAGVASQGGSLPAEGFNLQTGADSNERWIAVFGADERGLLFGIGKLLRSIVFSRQNARVDANLLNIASSPRYPLRGHQLISSEDQLV